MATPKDLSTKVQNKGLEDLHFAPITTNTATEYLAGATVKVALSIEGKYQFNYDKQNVYGDGKLQDVDVTFKDGTLEMTVFNVAPETVALIFGHKVINGMTVFNKNDKGSPVAVGYRSECTDNTYDHFWFYCVDFASESQGKDFKQVAEQSERQPVKLIGTIIPRLKDGNKGVEINETFLATDDTAAKALLGGKWFESVQEPLTENLPA